MNAGYTDIAQSDLIDLTDGQMKIWSGQMLRPEEPLYNMAFSFEIRGGLDVNIFQEAFQQLTEEHDVFRLVIELKNDLPQQRIRVQQQSMLQYIDLSKEASPEGKMTQYIHQDKERLFSPGELLYTTALFRLGSERYCWYINQHHIITDGWSYKLLYESLNTRYQSLRQGASSEQAQPTGSFKEYVQAHSFLNQSEVSTYWQDKQSQLTAPALFYAQQAKTGSGASTRVSHYLGKERTKRLKAFCLEPEIRAWTTDMALNNVFLTLMNALIYKTSGETVFWVGVPSHNRFTRRAKNTAGLYMELLPLACEIKPKQSFLELFENTRNESLEVLKEASKTKVPVEFLKSFNAIVNFIPQQFQPFGGYSTRTEWVYPGYHDPGHHLRLQIHDFDNKEDYLLQFDLNNEVFSDQKAKAVVDHFITLLDAFISDKHQIPDDIEIISEQEVSLINRWNSTEEPIPEGETLLRAFQKQAAKTPHNHALTFRSESISYLEFDEKSNQVAHYLMQNGLKPGDKVAVQLERSLELMYSLYGLLKARGVYVPIDVNNPADRTEYLLDDTRAGFLFTSLDDSACNGLIIRHKELIDLVADQPTSAIVQKTAPEDDAYIIYTSGSTGRPKGVVGYHKGICNKLRYRNKLFPLSEADVLIHKTPVTFDVSLWELFWPLQVGARLVIAEPNAHTDSNRLITLIKKHQITNIHFVPGMLNAFLEDKSAADCTSIKNTFCSGEALSSAVVDKFHDTLYAQLHNLYGPTEASVEVSYWTCHKDAQTDTIPIGFTVPNTRLYILDRQLNRVPLGTPGELCIAGVQVTKGYLNQPELTAAAFVPDVDPHEAGATMYKTGDLARYREDGAIEYLGRQDNQVKLRGFRIELEEIEAQLMKHPDISQAVVVKITKDSQTEYLVAYYTGALVEENQLKSLLGRYLPVYMIPSFFVFRNEFDLSSSGKVNRKMLIEHQAGNTQHQVVFKAPETQLQELLAEVWKEILRLEEISIYDQFIHLGGDSLKALMITSRVKEMLDLELSINLLFNYSDIASYAEHIEQLMICSISE